MADFNMEDKLTGDADWSKRHVGRPRVVQIPQNRHQVDDEMLALRFVNF